MPRAQGNFGASTGWVAEADFAGGLRLADFYVGLDAIPSVHQVRVGYFREPFSLEGATSSNVISFMERSTLNQFDPARNRGIAGSWLSDDSRMSLTVGGFRDDTSSTGISVSNQGCWAVTSRATMLPIY